MAFPRLPIDTDLDAITARLLDRLADRIPELRVAENEVEVILAEEIGRELAILAQTFSALTMLAVADSGQSVDGLAPLPGSQAALQAELTLTGPGVLTSPDDLVFIGVNSDGIEVAFVLPEPTPAGEDSTVTVTLIARDIGTEGNNVPTGPLALSTGSPTVLSAVATSSSSGGSDPETLESYVDRLVDYRAILRPGGVLARDLAVLARRVPGVYRALGIQNLDPIEDDTEAERTATVVPIDVNGEPVSAPTKAAVVELLESYRETNTVVHVIDPTYTAVVVAATVVVRAGFDPESVREAVRDAAVAWLDPRAWAIGEDPGLPTWEPGRNKVYFLDLVAEMGQVQGVDRLASVTINGGTADVTLSGYAPLPASGDMDPATTVAVTLA